MVQGGTDDPLTLWESRVNASNWEIAEQCKLCLEMVGIHTKRKN